ncbi:MAG: phosphotransferase family protein [Gammaproteobacteria bacterium]|nr:phosphotransferase family protein [Gammaproteobacteria bacterium]
MELEELEARLLPFCRDRYADPGVVVRDVTKMPGHAGFAYGFSVESRGVLESWFIRLPPPNVQWKGTADVLRQVAVLNALDGTTVPHCSVKWSGSDPQWFGSPYFVVPKLEGDVLRLGAGEWGSKLPHDVLHDLGRQAMSALAKVHRLDWRTRTPYLGDPIPFIDDVVRWDRFYERAADAERLRLVPQVRAKLLASVPNDAPVGLFHGDFQTANLFCSKRGDLLALIDWELTGIGATLNDVGWIATFSDPLAWPQGDGARPMFLDPQTLIGFYEDAWGGPAANLDWFRALAAYKFAIITGFNLSLHRRGKRHDPVWEVTKLAMETLMARADSLLRQ